MTWTVERCDKLKAMRAEGLSFGRIAVELKISRNAAIGKATRMGLPIVDRRETVMRTPRPKPKHRPQKRAQWKPPVRLPAPEPKPEPLEDPATDTVPLLGAGVSLLDLRNEHCRWPYGEGPFVFCGRSADMANGRCYCTAHARMAYQPTSQRYRRPGREAA